jgi:curli production assembly/transport component CsgG
MTRVSEILLWCVILCALCACGPVTRALLEEAPRITDPSRTDFYLETIPPPTRKVDVAVYNFPDLTGKNEPNDTVAVFSRAVTQGGTSFLVDALRRAGHGRWFTVVERTGLAALLQERQIITATRKEFDPDSPRSLPPLRFAGLLMEGGIIAYDANITTGGLGANYLGIGGDVKYRRDIVVVGLRVVSVQSGEVLTSVTTTKTVYSVGLNANTFRFVAVNSILQAEAGVTDSEPTQLAVRQAIDLAVYATIMEGARKGLWKFIDPALGQALVAAYLARDKFEPVVNPDVPVQAVQVSAAN